MAQGRSARASTRGKQPTYQISGDRNLIIPLNNGNHAYVINPTNGKNPKYATDTASYKDALALLVEHTSVDRVRKELTTLTETYPDHGWEKSLQLVDDIINTNNEEPADDN